ncbi:MAG: hypothetical protein FJ206_06470 [Gemmatimonadetes bacterium]|nr:hypothetical protein [Gemmatimonadota bacterium]
MTTPTNQTLSARLALAFQPLDKRAFGVAIGVATGSLIALATVVVLFQGGDPINLGLLAEYFAGYRVSWSGVAIGFFWGFVAGFAAGWFVAFWRNFIVAASVFAVRTRADLAQSRDFLDHI